jgi:hypothetical protein
MEINIITYGYWRNMILLTLDDYCDDRNGLDYLFRLKARYPKFKVTLWTVPCWTSHGLLEETSKLPWIEMGLHGWTHEADEVQNWDDLHMKSVFAQADALGYFKKMFHSPGWGYNPRVWEFCKEVGWILEEHPDHTDRIVDWAKTYVAGGAEQQIGQYKLYGTGWGQEEHDPDKVLRFHGHTGDKGVTNSLKYHFPKLMSYPEDTEFIFLSEIFKN